MGWDPNSLVIDVAEEFASFADLSREDFRREMRAQQQADRRRERRRARLGMSRAIVKRVCIECGVTFDDVIHRQGIPRIYCNKSCFHKAKNRRYKLKKIAQRQEAILHTLCTAPIDDETVTLRDEYTILMARADAIASRVLTTEQLLAKLDL